MYIRILSARARIYLIVGGCINYTTKYFDKL